MSGLIGRATLLCGQAYLEMLRYREAMEDFGVVVQTEPENAEAYYNVGKASLRLVVSSPGGIDQGGQSQLLQGAQSLEQAIKLKPDYGAAYLERGRILFRLSDMDLAIKDSKKAVELGRSIGSVGRSGDSCQSSSERENDAADRQSRGSQGRLASQHRVAGQFP